MREAHPIDGKMPSDFGLIEDPIDDKERANVAGTCVKNLELPMPALVDHVDNKVQDAYGGWPDRLYLVGKDGKIVFAGARGPRGFDPEEWDAAIVAEKSRIAAEKTAAPARAGENK